MKPLLIAATLALAACSSMAAPASPAPPPTADAGDQCHASQYQWLVGRKMSELPPKPEGAVWRQACATCMLTMDFSATRMNIIFDRGSEEIKTVKCG